MADEIKEAFKRAKQDIFFLGEEISNLKFEISEVKTQLQNILNSIEELKIQSISTPTHQEKTPTTPTHLPTHPETPTDNLPLKALKSQNTQVSIGNGGVPTDRQTDRQTDRHIFQHIIPEEMQKTTRENHIEKAIEILESLDSLKKEIRLKFKRLTPQEMAIFSLLYSLDEAGEEADYKILATKTNLSESSIRDYIQKISSKGVPIIKEKIKNKRIILHISQDLKKIATLDSIIRLREL